MCIRDSCIGLYYVDSANAYANSFFEYDGSGALAKERTNYCGMGFGDFRITYYRDENGERIISENNEYLENGLTRPAFAVDVYDKSGGYASPTGGLLYNPDGTPAVILPEEELQNIFRANTDEKFYEYRYDEAGNVIARISYDMEKHFVLTENYVYDDAGRLIQRKIFSDGGIYGSAVYLYDDTGTLSEIQFTDEYHGMGEQYLYFDEAGNVIRYVGNKNGREMLFDYDEKGTPLQKTVNLSWNSDKALSLIHI